MKQLLLALAIGMVTTSTWGSEADPRAVASCKGASASFVQIASCLPGEDVAFKTLDAFDKIYPPAASPLKLKCIELNKGSMVGAMSCVTEAISAAIELQSSLPKDSSLGDPIFDAVSNASLNKKLAAEIEKAKLNFPDQMWGGNMYHPYK